MRGSIKGLKSVVFPQGEIFHADCRDVLPRLEGVADLLLTDCPYRVTSGGNSGEFSGGWMGEYQNGGNIVDGADLPFEDWLPAAYAALTSPAHAYLFINDRNLAELQAAAEAAGLAFHRLLIWDKGAALPNRWYQQTCEFVLFMRKGRAFRIAEPSSRTYARMPQVDETPHPTEKPVALCRHYIANSTKPGDMVLDPFAGSGTTCVAAIHEGRRFVACESNAKWFDIACRRIAAVAPQPGLFEGT